VQAQKFINAYAAFLKRQGKLPIPGMMTYATMPDYNQKVITNSIDA
jgi:ribosomal protein S19E (S16A)